MKPGGRRWQSCRARSVSSDWQSTTSNSMSPLASSPSTPPLLTLLLTPLIATSRSMADTAHATDRNHTCTRTHLIMCCSLCTYTMGKNVFAIIQESSVLFIPIKTFQNNTVFVSCRISTIYSHFKSLYIFYIPIILLSCAAGKFLIS